MKLQDLKLEDFDFGREETAPVPEYNDYPNGTFMIVSKVAFLLGVDRKHFESEIQPPKMEWYNFLKNDRNARIVRNLCMLRNDLERNYSAVYTAMTSDVKNLNTLPQYILQEALTELEQDGILILKTNAKPVQYIIELNKKINDRINNCKSIFPIWLNWEYIKQLYIMPGGTSESGAKAAADEYYANRKSYPYQMYINWNGKHSLQRPEIRDAALRIS